MYEYSLPVLVALYMFSIEKTSPRLYSKTLAKAGTNCVVVTKTFTQRGLSRMQTRLITRHKENKNAFNI